MHDFETLKSGGYRGAGLAQLKLACPLGAFPERILELGETLEQLDLSGTGLWSLPAGLGAALPNLKIALFSDCRFKVFPRALAACPNLETVAFGNNGMEEIPEDSLPPRLGRLILTGNRISSLPASMAQCQNLALLRLSDNRLPALPAWLFALPSLAFLSFAGNPCAAPPPTKPPPMLATIPWTALTLSDDTSDTTAPGLWQQSADYAEDVAIQLFRGAATSDRAPRDELAARLAAGAHESLVGVLGRIDGHPDEHNDDDDDDDDETRRFHGGLVLQPVPAEYVALGRPPRDNSRGGAPLELAVEVEVEAACVLSMLTGIAGAAAHLHARGIAHGDLSAHNVLASTADAHALVGGFGAATVYGRGAYAMAVERIEVLAFAHLVGDMLGLVAERGGEGGGVLAGLGDLHARCAAPAVDARPAFDEVVEELEGMMGWRGMMRIPDVPAPN
ncbi:outer arm dynein light chain 1 [Trichocladium antarcticum]|uniref:Outer arm dynein light chain 1 n=1 Tax=Trichocladium antarcticum TaxID=1450529 RepID=A0AAN6UIZ0_9PEZI|nr:outer arm dynein light chain 1 [Trichocladium antarcticum]